MIREELPSIVRSIESATPRQRAALRELDLETEPGRRFRDFALWLLNRTNARLTDFAADVAQSSNAWDAVVRFGKQNNAFVAETRARVEREMDGLSPQDRAAMEKAITETYGRQ